MARALAVVAMLSLSLVFLFDAIPAMDKTWTTYPYDGFIDWGGAREMWGGRDPYSPAGLRSFGLSEHQGLGHPPTTLIWFYPFAQFDVMMMKHVFTILTLIMLLYHVAIVTKTLRLPAWPLTTLLVFSGVYQMDWFILHLSQVDISELIAFLYVLCWFYLRQGRDELAGTMAGLACTLKLYPGLLVLFLLATRRFKAVVFAGLAYLAFVLEAVRRLGFGCFRRFLEQTASYANVYIANIRNASVDGIVHRLFYPVWLPTPGGRPVLAKATALCAIISVAMFALAWWVSKSRLREARRSPERIDVPFALFSILSMAPGPYQWEHYSVTLILPFLVLLAEALRGPRDRRFAFRVGAVSALLLVVFEMLDVDLYTRFHSATPLPAGARTFSAVAHVVFYDVTTWLPWFTLACALGVLLVIAKRGERQSTVTPPCSG